MAQHLYSFSLEGSMRTIATALLWLGVVTLGAGTSGCGPSSSTSPAPGGQASSTNATITAKVQSVLRDKMVIQCVVDGKQTEVPFAKQTKFFSGDGFDISDSGNLSRAFQGVQATIRTERQAGKDVAVEVRAKAPGD
jgi:hypothetical protein